MSAPFRLRSLASLFGQAHEVKAGHFNALGASATTSSFVLGPVLDWSQFYKAILRKKFWRHHCSFPCCQRRHP